MKISIISPNYNYGRFLRDNLESVVSQLTPASDFFIEHIVMDGKSSDDSVDILKKWESETANLEDPRHSRYSFKWESETDDGQTDAINKGLLMASGDVVCWLNSDERYLPDTLSKIAAAFDNNPDIDFIYGEPMYVNSEGKKLRIKRDHPFSGFVLLWHGCYIASCCSFWRQSIIKKGILLDKTYKVVMDGEYWTRLMKLGYRFKFVPVTVAQFTWHKDNISTVYDDIRLKEVEKIKLLYAPMVFSSYKARKLLFGIMDKIAHFWRRVLVVIRIVTMPR